MLVVETFSADKIRLRTYALIGGGESCHTPGISRYTADDAFIALA